MCHHAGMRNQLTMSPSRMHALHLLEEVAPAAPAVVYAKVLVLCLLAGY
jgi:hypothetical protein